MLQHYRLWFRLLMYPLLGGSSHAVCQQAPEIETDGRGEHLVAATVAVALPSRRAGAAGGDSVALSHRRDSFFHRRRPAYQSTAGRALYCQGPGTGRTLGLEGPAGPRPPAGVERGSPSLGGRP